MLYVNPMATSYASRLGDSGFEAAERKVAVKELEQHFVFTLLQEMRKTIPKSGLLDGGFAQSIQEQMLDEALSGAIAETGQFGIAKMVEEQLRIQEAQHTASAPLSDSESR